MKSPILLLALLPLSLFAQPNALTEEEKATGFELWFDGKALDGWKHSGNWRVDDAGSILVPVTEEVNDTHTTGRKRPAEKL